MSRLTRDGTAEPVSRDQILRHARGQGNIHFPCSADHEQDCQPYPVDSYSAICDDHTMVCSRAVECTVVRSNNRSCSRDVAEEIPTPLRYTEYCRRGYSTIKEYPAEQTFRQMSSLVSCALKARAPPAIERFGCSYVLGAFRLFNNFAALPTPVIILKLVFSVLSRTPRGPLVWSHIKQEYGSTG